MKETSTAEEKQTLVFTKNNRLKCSRRFRYLRKRNQPFFVQEAEIVLSKSKPSSVKSQVYVNYLQIILQQKHISERLDGNVKSKALDLAEMMHIQPQQSGYKKNYQYNIRKASTFTFSKNEVFQASSF